MDILRTYSPNDGTLLLERPFADDAKIARTLERARRAQLDWGRRSVSERARQVGLFVDAFVAHGDAIAAEITAQMGRPIRHAPGEIRGFEDRARTMIDLATPGLADIEIGGKPGFIRFIRHVPVGVVFVVAPWNYPYLTSVNAIVPALLAGNAVVLKHSAQTPLCAERLADAAREAGLPEGVFSFLHLSHASTQSMIASSGVDFVAFTGSVEGGRAVERSAAGRFIGLGLELGGKDPAYVRADADLAHAVDSLVDGAFYNAGQSCCGIERIYVARPLYDDFVAKAVALAGTYVLGDAREPATTLGPMVRAGAADFVREQIREAVASGATAHLDERGFARSEAGTAYLAPQILTNVDHRMRVMSEESFGPVVGIMPVDGDDDAVRLMNDSVYGLTACVYTSDVEAAVRLGDSLETGTVFMNRCDYLDPSLAWTGVKDSGRGCSLSVLGFSQLTRPKSFHLKLP